MEQSLLCVGKGVIFSKLSLSDSCLDTAEKDSERDDKPEAFKCLSALFLGLFLMVLDSYLFVGVAYET